MLSSCGANKNNIFSRSMQNMSSRYNYLYNAQNILSEYHLNFHDSAASQTGEISPLILPASFDPQNIVALDKVISKAQFIINDKSKSKHLPEAYLLLAEANFLKGNYFLSKAYFDYVARTYNKDRNNIVKALDGSTRNLIQLGKLEQAAPLLDSLKAQLPLLKKGKGSPMVTLAQSSIIKKDYQTAILYIEAALKENASRHQKNRWTYTLAQLYKAEQNYVKANDYFEKLEKWHNRNNTAASLAVNDTPIIALPDNPDKHAVEATLAIEEIQQTENTPGKNFNTLAEKHRKKGYFTYVQQQLSPALQHALQETPLKNLPLPTAKNEESVITTTKKTVVADNIFEAKPANSYYFVIAVSDASINLSPSRFRIGEFNRGNFAANGLKHRLTEFDNDQLIYIGNFSNFEDVNLYAEDITPQLKQIMKTPATSYNSFIISKENFEKINSKELLNKYLEFNKNNFLK